MLQLLIILSAFFVHVVFARPSPPSVVINSLSKGPVIAENFADPSFIHVRNYSDNSVTYYAFSTGSVHGNTPVATSTDFATWIIIGDALPIIPSWSYGSIWAPDVVQIVGIDPIRRRD